MLTLLLDRPSQHVYAFESLVINFHWNEFRSEHLHGISDINHKVTKEHGQMTSIIVMRGALSIDLSNEMRLHVAEMMRKFDRFNVGQALVIESEGFRSSLARSVLTGINLLARASAKQRVFKDPREATEWICGLDKQPRAIRERAPELWPAFDRLLRELPQA